MSNFLTSAGSLVWPTLLSALAAVALAALYFSSGERRHAACAWGATFSGLVFALLGLVLGFQRSIGGLHSVAVDDRWIYLLGVSESLNPLLVALLAALVVGIVSTLGYTRHGSHGHGAVVRREAAA